VTDRELRYRARLCAPDGPHICGFCASTDNVDLHHIDGHEEHTEPANLMYLCRRCNVRVAIAMAHAGLGRPTRQFNPQPKGAKNLGQWLTAVLSAKGESQNMDADDAVSMIRATPPQRRSEFAQQIWEIRRRRGTDRKG
jgi:uncharacterized protein YlaI